MPIVVSLLFLAAVVSFPGLALIRFLPRLPEDGMLKGAMVVALGLSVALFLSLVGFFLQISVWSLTWLLAAAAGFSLIVAIGGVRRRGFSVPLSWGSWLAVSILVFSGWYQQSSFNLGGDGPELVASLRETVASGKFFPTETHFLGAGLAGADIRKGLLHPLFASCLRLSGDHLLESWLRLPILFAIFPFLSAYGFVRLSGLGRGWAYVGAILLLLTLNGGISGQYAALSSNPKVVAACLFWLSSGLALYSLRTTSPRAGVFAALLGVGAGLAHPMVVVFLTAFYGVLLLWTLFVSRTPKALLAPAGVLLIGLLPYYVIRYQTYDPQNPLHMEIQGMVFAGAFRIYSPLLWLTFAGWLAVPAYLGFLAAQWRRWRDPVHWWGWWASLGILMAAFNPLLVPTVQKYLTYLVFRLPWMFPAALAAPILLAAWPASRKRTALVLLMGLSLLPALPPLVQGRLFPPSRDTYGDLMRERAAFASLDAVLPPRSTVVADPTVSYLIPALTDSKVICTFDQHSTPNDGRAVERILAARKILSPALPDSIAWNLAKQEGAEYVLFWKKPIRVLSVYWQVDPESTSRRIAQFRVSPYFSAVPSPDAFALFALVEDPPSRKPPANPPPAFPLLPVPRGTPLVEAYGLRVWSRGLDRDQAAPGDTLWISFSWQRTDSYAPAPLLLAVRLTAASLPGGNALGGKLWRKVMETVRGEEYQIRAEVPPGGGTAPPSIWPNGYALDQTIPLRIPAALRPGTYLLQAQITRRPAVGNYRASDFLYNKDIYSGAVFDTIRVVP